MSSKPPSAILRRLQTPGRRVLVGCWSEGSVERMGGVLSDHGITALKRVNDWRDASRLHERAVGSPCCRSITALRRRISSLITEEDILGDRMVRPRGRARRSQHFLQEASALTAGDLVTHIEHGIGRYLGLKTIEVQNAPHDCLELQYDGGKLFLPVENIELLTRFGSEECGVQLDRLGGAGWQHRKARMKARIREMAAELIRIAAARALKEMPAMELPRGIYDEFCARFPYVETEDQERAIADVVEDLTQGPADGPPGLRRCRFRENRSRAARGIPRRHVGEPGRCRGANHAAGAAALPHLPRTLRADFRFASRNCRVLFAAKEAKEIKAVSRRAKSIIIIGTHALLAKSISFRDLGLLIVDEEQHFGVAHKERLKACGPMCMC